jgi:hypothetical protein
MTVILHKVPSNITGITPAPTSTLQGTYILQDVERVIYAQIGATGSNPTPIGWIPATSDGAGGISQLMRGPDMRYNSAQSTSGFGASGNSSTSVTVSYPSMSILFDGSMQSFNAGSWNGPAGNGTYSFGVAYQWGLTQFTLSVIDVLPTNYVELCTVTVTSTSATVGPARTNGTFMKVYGVPGGSTSKAQGIPVSDQNGAMPW